MKAKGHVETIDDFLGSTHIFAAVVEDIVQENLVKQASEGKVTYPQFKLLRLVALSDTLSIGDVAAFLGISNAAASKAVDRLVKKKLLQRTEFAQDRRAVRLSLTDAGSRMIQQYDDLKSRSLPKIFTSVSPAMLKSVAQVLDSLSLALLERAPEKARATCLQCGIFFRERCVMRAGANRNCFYIEHRSEAKA